MRTLDRLAERMGIELQFRNAAGEIQRTPDDVKIQLLEAMGMPAYSEQQAQARLEELERAASSMTLPPVMVVSDRRPALVVPVVVPTGTRRLDWRLQEEDGRQHRGTADVAALARLPNDNAPSAECRALTVSGPLPLGYHRLRVEGPTLAAAEMQLIIAPERCYLPDGMPDASPQWGIATQLYSLRSADNWGIGDFTDLARLVDATAGLGGAAVGLNPLHALFLDAPSHASPYSPASREFLNTLYIDVTAVPEFQCSSAARAMVRTSALQKLQDEARAADRVDYPTVTKLKLPVLELLYREFVTDATPKRRDAFDCFRRERGTALERFCRFQALREHFAKQCSIGAAWHAWPKDYRRPDSPAVERFAEIHRERIDFYVWLQWVADTQLGDAARRCREQRMPIGLYRDLAVGADSSGAETWANPRATIRDAHVGAPPDLFNPAGQDWGLPPFNPVELKREAYASFIALLRANMRHAGALRIDHVMALQHLYWIPEGRSPDKGAYESYPMEDLIGILALESQRHRCLVVGEDLGTVPEGFRERLAKAAILSYRVVFFEVDDNGAFIHPARYPTLALATLGNHDLATLRGWWEGRDICLKESHRLYPSSEETRKQYARRAHDRVQLLNALRTAMIALPEGFRADSPYSEALADAMHTFLARCRAGLVMVQLDDLTDEKDQVNLPGTSDQHPNWRRKLALSIEEIATNPRVWALTEIFRRSRPRSLTRVGPRNPV